VSKPSLALWTVVAAAVLSGCVTLPESGPVLDAGGAGTSADEVVARYVPPPPRLGATPTEIVDGFLDAMTATPLQTAGARQYLTSAAGAQWEPERQTIVYGEATDPRGQTRVSLRLDDAFLLDARGAFVRRLRSTERALGFRMDLEDGQWRIAEAPDALIVPQSWTDDHFRSVDVYYVDPTARILVPEPVSVPRGDQFATALMDSLLTGPGPTLAQVSRNFLPSRLTLGLSVPVDDEGIADVAFQGDASDLSPEEAELAAVQIAWTLRQDPTITAIQLTADGEPLPGLSRELDLDEGAEYDPTDFSSSTNMFALRDGRLVSGSVEAMAPLDGPAGQRDYGFTAVSLSLDATQVAGITGGGTGVVAGPTDDPEGSLEQVVSGATDLLPPAWDFADRIWLVDRTRQGARVSMVVDGRTRSVEVPGISGERVRHLLVSRDGSRLLAVVRKPRADVLMASRIQYDDRGELLAVTTAHRLRWPTGGVISSTEQGLRILDVAWQSPTSVAVLYPVRDLRQVRTLAVDGSPSALSVASPTLAGDFKWLIGSPDAATDLFAATPQGYTDLSEADRTSEDADVDLATLTYTG
jgi:hypothetical protein